MRDHPCRKAARLQPADDHHPRGHATADHLASAISSLDPTTGKIIWEVPSAVDIGMTVATPVHGGNYLLVTSFYNGARMLRLDDHQPAATMLWAGTSNSEIATDAIQSAISTPVIDGDYVYGVDSYGELRCLADPLNSW